jgi:hypothetical protein
MNNTPNHELIKDLRTQADEIRKDLLPRWKSPDETMDEAADRIEEQEKQIHKLLKTLEKVT